MNALPDMPDVPASSQGAGHGHEDSYEAIVASAEAYRRATSALDLKVRLGASEDVLRARLALAECLMDIGWWPTARILAVIHRDEALLMQSNGGLDPTDEAAWAWARSRPHPRGA
ncbi:MAG: hypothetical protein JWP11_819 [Frankiales bacterium]|nr:hypothetical protein [Frankiales bacterium]